MTTRTSTVQHHSILVLRAMYDPLAHKTNELWPGRGAANGKGTSTDSTSILKSEKMNATVAYNSDFLGGKSDELTPGRLRTTQLTSHAANRDDRLKKLQGEDGENQKTANRGGPCAYRVPSIHSRTCITKFSAGAFGDEFLTRVSTMKCSHTVIPRLIRRWFMVRASQRSCLPHEFHLAPSTTKTLVPAQRGYDTVRIRTSQRKGSLHGLPPRTKQNKTKHAFGAKV